MTSPAHRTWPAVLTLYVLAPVAGELLSGAHPPLLFFRPLDFTYLSGLYGSGAIVARELVRQRKLGWSNLLLMGAAYGVLEEGLVVMTWFNPHWPAMSTPHTYGRFLGISWVWALWLTAFHAVLSIAVPVVLAEAIFPRYAEQPWLGRRGFRVLVVWLGFISLLGFLYFGFAAYRNKGYAHPPVTYGVALMLACGLVWLGLHRRRTQQSTLILQTAPGLWTLRLAAFSMTLAFWFTIWTLHTVIHVAAVTLLIMAGIVILATWRVGSWARQRVWGAQQRLALASGVLGFFIVVWAPLIEFGVRSNSKLTNGMTVTGLCCLAGLIWLGHRASIRGYGS